MSPRESFDSEMEQLNRDLIRMGGMVEAAIEGSIRALLEQDTALATKTIEAAQEIDDMEKSIETRSLRLLLRQQPVARDLRAISTALKMITDLERIGDQAEDIAELSRHFKGDCGNSMAKHIPIMAQRATEMVRQSITAVIKNDMELAKEVIEADDEVDRLFMVVKTELVAAIGVSGQCADQAIDLMMVAKYLERIADHAVNISEWVIFYGTGLHKETKIL